MTNKDFLATKNVVFSDPAYNFLKEDSRIKNSLILLCFGGSHAYGTNIETSDIDVRGICLNSKEEILSGTPFDQIIDNNTDTVIYSFVKIMKLLTEGNPNVLELIFQDPDRYLYLSDIGKELIENKDMFLSKQLAKSFCGYATGQLIKLKNRGFHSLSQPEQEERILDSIKRAQVTFPEKYFSSPEDSISLYVDKSDGDFESEIFMDINLKHYPLRDYKAMWAEMHNIVKSYAQIATPKSSEEISAKVNKQAMHPVRLLSMCTEVLNTGKLSVYREKEHDMLMAIRNGAYESVTQPGKMSKEYFELIEDLLEENRKAEKRTKLPENPDYKRIQDFIIKVNSKLF